LPLEKGAFFEMLSEPNYKDLLNQKNAGNFSSNKVEAALLASRKEGNLVFENITLAKLLFHFKSTLELSFYSTMIPLRGVGLLQILIWGKT